MGSWNLTCAITRAPIHPEDNVRLIFLGMNPDINKHATGRLYTTDDWAPLSFPLAMTYDDYGRLSLRTEDDWAAQMFLDSLSKDIESGDVILKEGQKSPTTIPEVLQLVRVCALRLKGKATLSDNEATKLPVAIMVVHESAYELLSQQSYDAKLDQLVPALSKYLSFLTHLEREGRAVFARLPHGADNTMIPFWFGGHSDSIAPRVFGLKGPSPVDVIHDIHIRMRRRNDTDFDAITGRLCVIGRMMILQDNMDAQAIPYAPSMNASDDYDVVMQSKIAALAQSIYKNAL